MLVRKWFVGEACRNQRRDYDLLDFGAGPALHASGHPIQFYAGRVHATAGEVNLEDFQPFFEFRQVEEEYLVEPAFADDFRRQQVDAVGRRDHEQPGGLFLHPGQEEAEDAIEHAGFILVLARNAVFHFVEPGHRRGDVFQGVACGGEMPLRIADARREDLDQVDAIQRQLKNARHRPSREALAAA